MNMDNKLVSAAMRTRIELIENSYKDALKQKEIEINEIKEKLIQNKDGD